MSDKQKEARVRLNLTITPRVRDRLERLQTVSDAESLTEVVRRALAIYDDLLEVRRGGGRIVLEYADGRAESLRVF